MQKTYKTLRLGFSSLIFGIVILQFLLLATVSFGEPIWTAHRGIHLPNNWLTPQQRTALNALDPRMVVVLSDLINVPMVEYLRDDLDPSAEIFVRYNPTTCPTNHSEYENDPSDSNYDPGLPVVVAKDAATVVDEILTAYWIYHDVYNLSLTRWIPGNEPELEWRDENHGGRSTWDNQKWRDIANYYINIYNKMVERNGTPWGYRGYSFNGQFISKLGIHAPIELYTPGFSQFASVGISHYLSDGRAKRFGIDYRTNNGILSNDFNTYPVAYNIPEVRTMINSYKRFTWHNYWWPGKAWQQRTYQWFPPWLQDALNAPGGTHYPSRITEAGWIINALDGSGGADGHENWKFPKWDDFIHSEPDAFDGSVWEGYYESDSKNFCDPGICCAGGVALWLLASQDPAFIPMAALFPDDSQRPWYKGLIRLFNGYQTPRPNSIGGSIASVQGTMINQVTVSVSPGNLQATSNTNGGFFFDNLASGPYSVVATKTGYVPQTKSIMVYSDGNAVVSFSLQPEIPISSIGWSHVAYQTAYGYVRVTWNTLNIPSEGGIEWGTSMGYGQYTPTLYGTGYWHEARIENFTPGITYHFRVQATVAGSGTSYSGDYTFNVPKVAVPIDNFGVTNITTTSAMIFWGTRNVDATSQVDFGTTVSYGQSITDPALIGMHQMTLNNLLPATTYHVKATSTATNYNPGTSSDIVFTTATPVIALSNVYVDNITATTAVLHWSTDVASTSRADYGTTINYGYVSINNTPVTNHQLTLTNLLPGTTYHFKVTSTCSGYQSANSTNSTFITQRTTGTLSGGVYIKNYIVIDSSFENSSSKEVTTAEQVYQIENKNKQIIPPPPGLTPLKGATITIAGKTAITDSNGHYILTEIPAGTYDVTCSHGLYGELHAQLVINAGTSTEKTWVFTGKPY